CDCGPCRCDSRLFPTLFKKGRRFFRLPESIDQRSSGDSHRVTDASTASAVRYVIDASISRFTVRVSASGMLSAFGHSPTIAIRDFAGETQLNPGALENASLHVTVKAAS